MTYIAGGNIQAADYNTFVSVAQRIDEIYADLHPGATTLAAGADLGYGRAPATPVLSGPGTNPQMTITAAQWTTLFNEIRNTGTHQGVTTVPPLPAANPAPSSNIIAYNGIDSLIANLKNNRHNLAAGQTTVIPGTNVTSTSSWTTSLRYTFQVDFGSWNNARYFFNSGGSIRIGGSYTVASSPIELAWSNAISGSPPLPAGSAKSPFSFKWNSTESATGSNDAPLHPIGFWKETIGNPLTTAYQIMYRKAIGGGYYTSSFVQIEAKLNAAAGTNGLLDVRINLLDGDPTPDVKVAGVAFQPGYAVSSGAIAYPGPPIIVTSIGFAYDT